MCMSILSHHSWKDMLSIVDQVLKAQRAAARVVGAQGGGKAGGRESVAKVTSLVQLLRSFAETLRRERCYRAAQLSDMR